MKLLFIHGAGGAGIIWLRQTAYFAGSEAITLPGHPDGEPCDSIEQYADRVHDHIARQGCGRVILAGQSMGAGIALALALRHPGDVGGLALIGAGARLRVMPALLQALRDNIGAGPAWCRTLLAPMYANVDAATREEVFAVLDRNPVSVLLNDFLCCDRFDVMNRVAEIGVPTLLLCGENDVMTPMKYTQFLADRIAGARMAVIPGGGHMVFLEKPAELNREIEGFLAGLQS